MRRARVPRCPGVYCDLSEISFTLTRHAYFGFRYSKCHTSLSVSYESKPYCMAY
jgi:hypothetical protein